MGVISTTTNVKHQLDILASAAAGARIGRGAYSAGRSHGMASRPTAKKKLNMNNMTAATIPGAPALTDVVPARIAIHPHCPAAANSMRGRRPTRSRSQMGMRDDKKYATPFAPESSRERLWLMPTDCSKMTGASVLSAHG